MYGEFKSPCSPIGLFDSGVGGLTVMHEIMKALPHEQILYLGDTARLPYGEKDREAILRFSIENTVFLMEKKIKLLVVACNTASAYALDTLRQNFNVPIVDIIESGVAQAVLATKSQRIGVLATKATINSGVYQRALLQRLPQATILPIACPLLVSLVEENFLTHPASKLIIQEYLKPLKCASIDTLLLGCTHFPLLAQLMEEELPEVTIVNPATRCAEIVNTLLHSQHLNAVGSTVPVHRFFVSDNPNKFGQMARNILGDSSVHIEKY